MIGAGEESLCGDVTVAALSDDQLHMQSTVDNQHRCSLPPLVCRVCGMEGRKGCWTVPWADSLQ